MKNFKPGQQVVFRKVAWYRPTAPVPKDNDIVVISERAIRENHWVISGYEISENGLRQVFPEKFLFPLITDSELAEELASIPETAGV